MYQYIRLGGPLYQCLRSLLTTDIRLRSLLRSDVGLVKTKESYISVFLVF